MAATVAQPTMDNNRMPPTYVDHHNTKYIGPGSIITNSVQNRRDYVRTVRMYKNGDPFYEGKKFVIHPKRTCDMDHFMGMVTDGIDSVFGAVRQVFTPCGGTLVGDLSEMQNSKDYVAAGKERFRHIKYSEIGKKPPRPRLPLMERRLHPKMPHIAPRLYQNNREPITIRVYRNGEPDKTYPVLLRPKMLQHWHQILEEITAKSKSTVAVRKIYTIDGQPIRDGAELNSNVNYVACSNQAFKKNVPYDEVPIHDPGNRSLQSRRVPPRRITRTNQRTYATMHKERADKANTAADHRQNVRPKPRPGPYPPTESETFPNKPVKHKRETKPSDHYQGAPSTEADDQLRGGVYKAKQGRVKASEVQEDEDTHVDLPIDQIPAETIDDEEILDVSTHQKEQHGGRQEPQPLVLESQDREPVVLGSQDTDPVVMSSQETPVPSQRSDKQDRYKTSPVQEDIQNSPPRTPSSPARSKKQGEITPPMVEDEKSTLKNDSPVVMAETTSKSNSMAYSNQEEDPLQPQTTFKSNSMMEPTDVQYDDDDEDRVTFDTQKSKTEEQNKERQENEVPLELPLLSEDPKEQEVDNKDEVHDVKEESVQEDNKKESIQEDKEDREQDETKDDFLHKSDEKPFQNGEESSDKEDNLVTDTVVEDNQEKNKEDNKKDDDKVVKPETPRPPSKPEETLEELRKPDGDSVVESQETNVDEKPDELKTSTNASQDFLSKEDETARPETSTPKSSIPNGGAHTGLANEKDISQNEIAVNEVNVNS